MLEFLSIHENVVRGAVFVAVLVAMVALESAFPRRARLQRRAHRWFTNVGLIIVGTLVLRLVLPIAAVGVAALAVERGWGLFNLVALPTWLEVLAAIVLLDMLIYWQHVAMHRLPLLWRLHQVHHADRDLDASSGVRFHPLEIVLSMLYKCVFIALLGPAVAAVIIFEVLLNACALFNHANLYLPRWLDASLRLILVTPDMHRVHHSVLPAETNANYGFSLSCWDRLFASYVAQPAHGHTGMTVGLAEFQSSAPAQLAWALGVPFQGKASSTDEDGREEAK